MDKNYPGQHQQSLDAASVCYSAPKATHNPVPNPFINRNCIETGSKANTNEHTTCPSPSPSPSPSSLSFSTLNKIPDIPVQCDPETSILNAAILMKERRTHCLIIVDKSSGKLIGITTTKDIAFKAVAQELSLNTPISRIMTRNPSFTSYLTSANDALNLMVEKNIRHLPLLDENNVVVGMLNITACFYNAMIRLERLSEKSKDLQCTFNDLNENLDLNMQPNTLEYDFNNTGLLDLTINRRKNRIFNELKNLISLMKQPDLKSLLNDNDLYVQNPYYISSTTSIWDAAQQLLKENINAALILHGINFSHLTTSDEYEYDGNTRSSASVLIPVDRVIGILTTKDLVYRVVETDIDIKVSKVVRIMTPKPQFANDSMAVHNALRLMYEGKYLNLPIKNSNNEITGLVNVLDLTYALIKTLNNSTSARSSNESEFSESLQFRRSHDLNNPVWDTFWESLDKPLHGTSLSNRRQFFYSNRKHSTSNASLTSTSTSRRSSLLAVTSSDKPAKPFLRSQSNPNATIHIDGTKHPLGSEENGDVQAPNKTDVANHNQEEIRRIKRDFANYARRNSEHNENLLPTEASGISPTSRVLVKVKICEDESIHLGIQNKMYVFGLPAHSLSNDQIVPVIKSKLLLKISKYNPRELPIGINIEYKDSENDLVTIDSSDDLQTALLYLTNNILNLLVTINDESSSNEEMSQLAHPTTSNNNVARFSRILRISFSWNALTLKTTLGSNIISYENMLIYGGLGLTAFTLPHVIYTSKR